jgi:hypothetical protein
LRDLLGDHSQHGLSLLRAQESEPVCMVGINIGLVCVPAIEPLQPGCACACRCLAVVEERDSEHLQQEEDEQISI